MACDPGADAPHPGPGVQGHKGRNGKGALITTEQTKPSLRGKGDPTPALLQSRQGLLQSGTWCTGRGRRCHAPTWVGRADLEMPGGSAWGTLPTQPPRLSPWRSSWGCPQHQEELHYI